MISEKHLFIGGIILTLLFFLYAYLCIMLPLMSRGGIDGFDFGNDYVYIRSFPSCLVKKLPKTAGGGASIIVEGLILQYGFDEKHIILLTQNNSIPKESLDWVINKQSEDVVSFKDKHVFIEYLKNAGINLSLEDFPSY